MSTVTINNSTGGDGTLQFIRSASLLIGKSPKLAAADGRDDLNAFSAEGLRFAFNVVRATVRAPNTLSLRIYNLSKPQVQKIQQEYGRVVLSAGYTGNAATIFDGEIVYTMRGNQPGEVPGSYATNFAIYSNRESPTDTVLDITASDGQSAYNYAVISKTLSAGAKTIDMINALAPALAKYGVSIGSLPADLPSQVFARGVVLHGSVRDILDVICKSIRAHWTFENMQLQIVLNDAYIPGRETIINDKTGLVGMPRQELNGGVSFTCLLNPFIRMNSVIKLNSADIQQAAPPTAYNQLDQTQQVDGDGLYRAIRVGHIGDTRGQEWYTTVVAIGINEAGPTPASGLIGQTN